MAGHKTFKKYSRHQNVIDFRYGSFSNKVSNFGAVIEGYAIFGDLSLQYFIWISMIFPCDYYVQQ